MPVNTPSNNPSKALIIAAFAAIYIIWGSTYLGILLAIKSIPPFFMVAARFIVAGLILYLWCFFKGEKVPSSNSLIKIAFTGILMLYIGNGAVTWVEQYLPSGLAAIIVATVPLWFVLLDKREWKFYFSNKIIIVGLLIGFAGVLMLFLGKGTIKFDNNPMKLISVFVLIAGTISWAIGSLYSKYKPLQGSTTMKAAIQMLAAGILALITGFISKEQDQLIWSQVSWTSIGALLYLIMMGSLVGYMSYVWLLSVRSPSLVGTYAYVNPIVAVFLGWLFANEQISTQQIIALSIVIVGVLLVNFSKEKKSKEITSPIQKNSKMENRAVYNIKELKR